MQVETLRGMLDDECSIEARLIHHYCCDHIGTPVALINQEGHEHWQIELDAWGKAINECNPSNLNQAIRMQGQHFDTESNLHYNRHRYFANKTSRYINQDPIGLAGGTNLYNYAVNPTNYLDPLGLSNKNNSKKSNSVVSHRNKIKEMDDTQVDEHTGSLISKPPLPIDKVLDRLDPNKKAWEKFSPYDYTQYCKKWREDNGLTCGRRGEQNRSDVIYSKKHIETSMIPAGFKCIEPYYFPELLDAGTADTAGPDDMLEILASINANRRIRARK